MTRFPDLLNLVERNFGNSFPFSDSASTCTSLPIVRVRSQINPRRNKAQSNCEFSSASPWFLSSSSHCTASLHGCSLLYPKQWAPRREAERRGEERWGELGRPVSQSTALLTWQGGVRLLQVREEVTNCSPTHLGCEEQRGGGWWVLALPAWAAHRRAPTKKFCRFMSKQYRSECRNWRESEF